MTKIKNLAIALSLFSTLIFTNCLHIIEEVNVKNNGTGSYSMTMDMSEMKSMMDMMKTMTPETGAKEEGGVTSDMEPMDSTMVDQEVSSPEEVTAAEDPTANPASMGQEFTKVAETLKNVKGITNVKELNDTSAYKFGYSFDYQDIASLNRALLLIGKEKFDSKSGDMFVMNKKNFERTAAGNLGEEIKKALGEEGGGGENMAMMKMFLADMTVKQIYHFESKVKKSSNPLAELTDDNKTLTIELKPFSEDAKYKNAGFANKVKLK